MPGTAKDMFKAFAKLVKDNGKTFHFALLDGPAGPQLTAETTKPKVPGAILGTVTRRGDIFVLESARLKGTDVVALNKAARAAGFKAMEFVEPGDLPAQPPRGKSRPEDPRADPPKAQARRGSDAYDDVDAITDPAPPAPLRKLVADIAALRRNREAQPDLKALDAAEALLDDNPPDLAKARKAVDAIANRVRQRRMDAEVATAPLSREEKLEAGRPERERRDRAKLEAAWEQAVAPHFEKMLPHVATLRGTDLRKLARGEDEFRAALAATPPDLDRARGLLAFYEKQILLLDQQKIAWR